MEYYYEEQAKDLLRLLDFPLSKRDEAVHNLADFMRDLKTMDVHMTYAYNAPRDAVYFKKIGTKNKYSLWVYK